MILIIDSFFTGSHKYWGIELQKRLPCKVELLTLSGKHWKWRMEGGAYELAQKFKKKSYQPKVIIATDMVNIPMFYGFANIKLDEIPCIMYFHENQFAYPKSPHEVDKLNGREHHYSFINLSSALFANEVVFNSKFNEASFLEGASKLIKELPSNTLKIETINTHIIYPGIEKPAVKYIKTSSQPVLLWNHRWEHDKNYTLFIKGLEFLKMKSIDFKLIILGKGTEKNEVKKFFENHFKRELIHCGYVETRKEYCHLLSKVTHVPVTSKHDFFGLSVAEAMSYGCFAILPKHQAYPEHLDGNEESGLPYDFPNGFYEALENSISTPKKSKVKDDFIFENVVKKWTQLLLKVNN